MGTSELLQHEIDHLNGVLSIDHARESELAMEQNIDVSKIKREEFEQRKEFYKRFVDDYVIVPTI